ncbi:MAG: hypothetical protein MRERV_36c026 [Mycoplasmataceae bacterium RV_VA103A]|nr:MAG: hypothetical protein MRERV_36c026 [Mycoplasmataceae bacterium RV_VA103A]
MLFSFEWLITKCISDPTFTNRLEKSKVRGVLAKILKKFTEYSTYTLEQLKENDRHFRFIANERQKNLVIEKISKYHWDRKNITSLLRVSQICQLSLGSEEERVIGILRRINSSQKNPERNHLFWPLHLDFEHACHPNLRKKDISKLDLVCIMEGGDCH